MQAWGLFSMLAYIVVLYSLPNYALSVGLTPSQGAIIAALMSLGQGLGRPFIGAVSDRAGRINIAAVFTFFCGVFCLAVWTFARSYGLLIFFAIVIGSIAGVFWAAISPGGAEVVGVKELPSALSITSVVVALPCLGG